MWWLVAILGGIVFVAMNALVLNPPEALLDFFSKKKDRNVEKDS